MTCFRTADGKTARSQCKNISEYTRFYRAMEKGATVEEALEARTIVINKSCSRSPLLRRFKEVLESFDMDTYSLIHNCMYRRNCSIDEAISWAARTGRVKLKHNCRKEFLKRC